MIWFLLFLAIFVIAAISQGNSNMNNFEKNFGFKMADLKDSGTYVSGHPSLDKSFKKSYLILDNNAVKIFEFPPQATGYVLKATIQKDAIFNVAIEDASTIQNRVTVGRLLLTGVFAFAWKKKEKQECAYFIIEWNLNQFKNETIFEFEGKGSIEKANTLRNKFINYLSESPKENISSETKTNENSNIIPHSELDKYIYLIKNNRNNEAVNLFIYNNRCSKIEAENYIHKLTNETNLQK